MGRLKEAWLTAVEEGREDQFLDSFPELDEEDKLRVKNLLAVQGLVTARLEKGSEDAESKGVPDQGS